MNIDFSPSDSCVIQSNFLNGFPFGENSFQVVYSSHVLEHFTLEQGEFLLREAYRILKNQGILRIVVPDFEAGIREYVAILDSHDGSALSELKHEWIMVELLDQLVRTKSQGIISKVKSKFLNSDNKKAISYLQWRTGENFRNTNSTGYKSTSLFKKFSFGKIREKILIKWVRGIKKLVPPSLASCVSDDTTLGEKHRWMYDRIGLTRLVSKCGFTDLKFLDASNSQIPFFSDHELDIDRDGKPHKLFSLYLEARK